MNTQTERAFFTKTARKHPLKSSIAWAVSELYGRRFPPIKSMMIEGQVMATKHVGGETAVCVLGVKTAVYIKQHRAFVEYMSQLNEPMYATGNFSGGMAQLNRLTSAINGLALTEKEKQFLIVHYQELLAIG